MTAPATTTASTTTAHRSGTFPVRRLGGDYTDVERYFYADQPVGSLFAITGSLLFPDGEMFFVNAIRQVKDAIADPALAAEVRAFIGQEGSHAGEHRRVNKLVERDFGIDASATAELMNRVLGLVERHGSPKIRLAITAALEHFTAIIAATLLADDHFAENVTSPALRSLIMWHAIEESEHRAVALDVYRYAGGRYPLRAAAMLAATGGTALIYGQTFVSLLAQDGQLTNVRSWTHFGHGALRHDGLLRPVIRRYWSYFKPGFHPHEEDTSADEARWRARLALKG